MALIVETGSGTDPTANSYASLAEAQTYLTNSGRAGSAAWSNLSSAQRSEYLVLAAQYMVARWNGRWMGDVAYEDQPLDWPRVGAFKKSGNAFQSTEVPTEVKNAQIEYAYAEASNPGSLFPTIQYDDTARPLVSIRERVEGAVSEERQFSDRVTSPTRWRVFPVADALIRHLTGRQHLRRA